MTKASDTQRLQEYFTRSAVSFDSLYAESEMTPFWRWVNRTFRRDVYERFLLTMEYVKASTPRSALDVGCGSGRYAVALAEQGVRRIVGVDLSPSMIDLARRHIEGRGTSIEFVCTDFMQYFPEERFGVIVAMGFFDYVADPVAVLRKMASLADHSVIASFPSISIYRTPIRKIRYAVKRCPVYFYRPGQLAALSRKAGFAALSVRKIRGSGSDYVATFYKEGVTVPLETKREL